MEYRVFWHFPPMFNPNNFKGTQEYVFSVDSVMSSNIVCFHKSANLNIDLQEAIDPKKHPLKESLQEAERKTKKINKKKKK